MRTISIESSGIKLSNLAAHDLPDMQTWFKRRKTTTKLLRCLASSARDRREESSKIEEGTEIIHDEANIQDEDQVRGHFHFGSVLHINVSLTSMSLSTMAFIDR